MSRLRRLPWKKITLLSIPTAVVAGLAVFGVAYAVTDVPPPNSLSQEQSTVIRYAGGEELARLGTNRVLVPLSSVSDPAQKAILAAEDRGFYTEPGISPRGIARALFTNLRGGGGVQQGGSSITQQYAKNAFLSTERTYTRKIKEVLIALKMTQQLSKEKILEDYLNTIYFGRGAYGIEAASKAYFGSGASAATLTPAQAAVLASSIRSPAGYDPAKHPERAAERWGYVLDGMVDKGWLAAGDRPAAYPEVVAPGSQARADRSGPAGHVIDAVQQELLRRGYAEDEVNVGGLVVTTTLDKRSQDAAVKAVEAVNRGDKADDALQGALVAVSPADGAIRAYYGGANGAGLDYAGGLDPSSGVLRQPGSSMKPYVLATALEKGVSLRKTFDGSSPQTIAGSPVRNFGNRSLGRVDLVTATEDSVNTVYFQLGVDVGPGSVADLAHRAGIPQEVSLKNAETGRTEGGISLGVYEVHVVDQAVGFATFAAGGEQAPAYLVAKVERQGRLDYEAKPAVRRAFDADVAADATYAMQQVVARGSATRAQLAGGRPAAGKTGTTSDSADVWFVGYTPQLSAAVWFGYGDRRTVTTANGRDATGGAVSSAVWKAFMDAAMQGQPVKQFPKRADLGKAPAPRRTVTPAPTRSASRAPSPTATPSPTETPAPTGTPSDTPSGPPPRSASPRPPTPLTIAPSPGTAPRPGAPGLRVPGQPSPVGTVPAAG